MFWRKKKRKEQSLVDSAFCNEYETRNEAITKESAMNLSCNCNEQSDNEEIEDMG